jgi:hypothetical protein
MTVHHCHRVRSCAVDFGVDESLQKQHASPAIDAIPVEIMLNDVIRGHEGRRKRTRH